MESGKILTEIDGIKYFLDLSEIIDNGINYGNFEVAQTRIIRKYLSERDTIVDVGANIGYYTLMCANILKKGKVYAFEPTNKVYLRLVKNIRVNNFKNIVYDKLAISDKNYCKKVSIRNSWKINNNNYPPILEKIKFVRLDDYFKSKKVDSLSFIKIDVEGMELEVIKGALKTLKKFKPKILIELGHRREDIKKITEILSSIGYNFYNLDEKRINPEKIIDIIPKNKSVDFFVKVN